MPNSSAGPETDFILSDDIGQLRSVLSKSRAAHGVLIRTDSAAGEKHAEPSLTYVTTGHTEMRAQLSTALRLPITDRAADPIICLGASTGGIDALICVLQGLRRVSCPVLIVQHTGPGRSLTLMRVLSERTKLNILPADEDAELQPGQVYLATDAQADTVLRQGQPNRLGRSTQCAHQQHTPSINGMFQSAALLGRSAIGVLLTGMGHDGAAGLRDMHLSGALTIVQDAETSVVYGMPKAAFEIGAACKQLPLTEIGPHIMEYLKETRQTERGTGTCQSR